MLDTPRLSSRPRGGSRGVLLADFTPPGAGDGLEEFVADPELEHAVADEHVAGAASVVLADADVLPPDTDQAVGCHPAGDPLVARPLRRRSRSPNWPSQLEAALWRGIGERLVRPGGVVVRDPFIQRLLGDGQAPEYLRGVELEPQGAVE